MQMKVNKIENSVVGVFDLIMVLVLLIKIMLFFLHIMPSIILVCSMNSVKSLHLVSMTQSLHIKGLETNSMTQVKIISYDGRLILEQELNPNQNSIDTKKLKAGLYFIQVESEKGIKSHTFFKE